MRDFRKLDIWNDGLHLVSNIYELCHKIPTKERYGLTSQLQRASISIPSNVAEGCRGTQKEFAHFLSIALGSAYEVETQILICRNLGYITMGEAKLTIEAVNSLQRRIAAYSMK